MLAYRGEFTTDQALVLELYFLIATSAPEFGVVVLNHTDPVGALLSAVFHSGLLECADVWKSLVPPDQEEVPTCTQALELFL